MLLMDDIDLVYTILHEMVHGTVFFPDSVDFNEQLATFVGWQGTVAFMEKIYGADSPQARMARQILREEIRLGQFLNWAYDRMLCYYALPLQSDQKVRGRQQIFEAIGEELRQVLSEMGTTRFFPLEEIVWNNASLLALWRYRYDSGDLECLYTHLGSDLRSLMALMKAWREDELDPQRAMKQQLADWSLKNAS
jgi:predicted aminopeptidase